MLNQNQSAVDTNIGSNNYDVGHVVTRQSNNGVAQLAVVGDNGNKAKGVSATNPPTGDVLAVDYVSHELGHQFAGEHTWANCGGGNGGGSAYEPFSASTIMGYAGICGGGFNLQNNSDAMFNWSSITEIRGEVTSGNANNAATITNTGNNDPTVNAGANFTIPEGTPFELTAVGSDPDGDTITYSWEQADLSNPSPFLRVWLPTEDPTRVFPRMQSLLNNTTVLGESLPTNSMNIDFRVVARDNSPLSAGHDHDTMRVTVASNNQAFSVTSQNAGATWDGNSTETITWNVAGTTANGINTANVDIYFALDGFDYDILLASGVANDGSHDITVPNIGTTTGRVKVKGAGNIFFDINNANITIDPTVVGGGGQVGETGMVTGLTHVAQTISFANTYTDPVIVTGPTTYNGIDPLTVRVSNVTPTGFDVYVLEWDYLNGVHNAAEDFAFMVVEAGTHTLDDGTVIQAGHETVDENFTTVNFGTNFAGTPVVFSQTTTLNGPDAVANRIRNVSSSSFEVRLQEEQAANQIHTDETVDWIAIDQGVGSNGSLNFVAGQHG